MMNTLRDASTLTYSSHYVCSVGGKQRECHYQVWLKKPNYFRVEVKSSDLKVEYATLIGDGETAWLVWPNGRPNWEHQGEDAEAYNKNVLTSYLKDSAAPGTYSIGHTLDFAGGGMSFPILNPSISHGYTETLSDYLDGMKSLGMEEIRKNQCFKIEVSFMNGQRIWQLWLSRGDGLPRMLKQFIRVDDDVELLEDWYSVQINADMPASLFKWTPPADWTEWKRPDRDQQLLQPGTKAPNFDLLAANGDRIKLSDYRGQVIWFYIWRVGCPPCREGAKPLEELYLKYRQKGLVILGFNSDDSKQLALDFIRETGTTFPNIVDVSDMAKKVCLQDYKCFGVPVNYIIDGDGIIVDAWYGNYEGFTRALSAMKVAGLNVEPASPVEPARRAEPDSRQENQPFE